MYLLILSGRKMILSVLNKLSIQQKGIFQLFLINKSYSQSFIRAFLSVVQRIVISAVNRIIFPVGELFSRRRVIFAVEELFFQQKIHFSNRRAICPVKELFSKRNVIFPTKDTFVRKESHLSSKRVIFQKKSYLCSRQSFSS